MTPEEKQLLLKDICARLQSSLICNVTHKDSEGWKEDDMVLRSIEGDEGYFTTEDGSAYSCDFKPYLRPMSSMSFDERSYCLKRGSLGYNEYDKLFDVYTHGLKYTMEVLDFLNFHHFDYRGLIEKGLALEAPEGMYK